MGRVAPKLAVLLLSAACSPAPGALVHSEPDARNRDPAAQGPRDESGGAFAMLTDGDCVWIPPEQHQAQLAKARETTRGDLVDYERAYARRTWRSQIVHSATQKRVRT